MSILIAFSVCQSDDLPTCTHAVLNLLLFSKPNKVYNIANGLHDFVFRDKFVSENSLSHNAVNELCRLQTLYKGI